MNDDLLRRVRAALLLEHEAYSTEMGETIGWRNQYHVEKCNVCDLLREIDRELEPDQVDTQ